MRDDRLLIVGAPSGLPSALVEELHRRSKTEHPLIIEPKEPLMSMKPLGAMMAATALALAGVNSGQAVATPIDPFDPARMGMTDERRNAKRAKAAARRSFGANDAQRPAVGTLDKQRAKNKAARKARAKNRKR